MRKIAFFGLTPPRGFGEVGRPEANSLPHQLQLDLESINGNIVGMATVTLPIDQMTVGEKLMAMESLWDSLCRDEEQIPVKKWHKQVLDERRQLIETGAAEFVDWETVKANIRTRLS